VLSNPPLACLARALLPYHTHTFITFDSTWIEDGEIWRRLPHPFFQILPLVSPTHRDPVSAIVEIIVPRCVVYWRGDRCAVIDPPQNNAWPGGWTTRHRPYQGSSSVAPRPGDGWARKKNARDVKWIAPCQKTRPCPYCASTPPGRWQ
jgi:hypothetical protein